MVKYLINPDLWLSIVAIVISIVALVQTGAQIKLSNKQQLFDRRLEKYLLFKELLYLYIQNETLFIDKDSLLYLVDYPFVWLTNCALLEEMNLAMKNPLHQHEQKIFLSKCEMLEKAATEIELLWNDENGKLVGKFVRQYIELLKAMYKQQIGIKKLKEENEQKTMSMEVFEKQSRENAEMINLFDIVDSLKNTYQKLVDDKVEQHILKKLKI